MTDFEMVKEVASLISVLLAICGTSVGGLVVVIKNLKKPYNKLDERLKKLEAHPAQCQKKFGNDKESIDQIRRDVNHESRDLQYVKRVMRYLEEGVMLCMQHDIKGNHTHLLEKWMREAPNIHIWEIDKKPKRKEEDDYDY